MTLFLSSRVAAKVIYCRVSGFTPSIDRLPGGAICGAGAGLPLFAGSGARGRATHRQHGLAVGAAGWLGILG
jgi:hypothetical protein